MFANREWSYLIGKLILQLTMNENSLFTGVCVLQVYTY